jgi:hypothetical protein
MVFDRILSLPFKPSVVQATTDHADVQRPHRRLVSGAPPTFRYGATSGDFGGVAAGLIA